MIGIVTLKDIFKSMCNHFIEITNILLDDSDLDEPMERPVFKIFMDTVETGLYSSGLRMVKVYFNIYFYSENRKHSKSEIMDIEDKIAYSFLEPFKVKEHCAVYIDSLDFEKVEEGILNCSFDFEIATDESSLETMEELVIKEILEEE